MIPYHEETHLATKYGGHPNEAGFEIWGNTLLEQIKQSEIL